MTRSVSPSLMPANIGNERHSRALRSATGKVSRSRSQMSEAGLTMERYRIVKTRLDAVRREVGAQRVATLAVDDIEMPDVVPVPDLRKLEGSVREALAVAARDPAPLLRPGVDVGELVPEHDALHAFHPVIEAELAVDVALGLSVVAKPAQPFCERRLGGRDHAALAGRPEALGRIEAEAAEPPQAACMAVAATRAESLGGVLDDDEAVPAPRTT